jgi:hypothetical protein
MLGIYGQYLHVPKNFPTRVPWSSISNNSNNFLLQYEYLISTQGVALHDHILFITNEKS